MIKAEMIAASQHPITGVKIATMKVVMPRYILAEFNTHRMFSRNSASSRAIPFEKMANSVQKNPFIPIAWQKDHKGMQGTEYLDGLTASDLDPQYIPEYSAKQLLSDLWAGEWPDGSAAYYAIDRARDLNQLGATKQLSNRLIEPFMWHTVLVTATEWDNFFNLRCPQYAMSEVADNFYKSKKDLMTKHGPGFALLSDLQWLEMNKGQADIHMMALAESMYDCYNEAEFKVLQPGEWHIPYGDQINGTELIAAYEKEYGEVLHTGNLYHFLVKRVSVARCARLSYETLGDEPKINYLADIKLFDMLSRNGHLSPFEHVARAMTEWEHEVFIKTEIVEDKPIQRRGWCANFNSFIPYRSLIENAA